MRASVIVPVMRDLDQAWRCFVSLAQLPDTPSHEIVVVDDGAVGLDRLTERLGGAVGVVRTAGRVGFSAAVNAGAAVAAGEVLVVLRDTPEVAADWLPALVDALAADAVAAVSTTAGRADIHPVEGAALAVARGDFDAAGGCPPVVDAAAIAAMCSQLARRGPVVTAPASVVILAAHRPTAPRHDPRLGPELSIVIPTLEAAGDRVRACLRAIEATTPESHEVIVVDNGSSPQGYTAPVNAGIRAAGGRHFVIMNDDVEPLPGWWPPLRAGLEAGASVTFPMTIDTAMRTDFAAWCFALSPATVARFGVAPGEFFDRRFSVWFQDTDLLVRLREAGEPPVLVPESRIRHGLSQTVNSPLPELAAWIRGEVARDQQRFHEKYPHAVMTPRG